MEKNQPITIVGGGFTGLVCAYAFVQKGYKVRLFEKSSHLGGLIHTRQARLGSYETAANGLLNSQDVIKLSQDIKVKLLTVPKLGRQRYIFRHRLHQWPLKFFETIPFSFRLLKCWYDPLTSRPQPEETIDSWVRRTLGDAALKYLVAPALQGIYAGDPKRLSARLILDSWWRKSSQQVKSTKVRRETVFPSQGMGQLIDGLASYLLAKGVTMNTQNLFTNMDKNQGWTILATGPRAAAQLLKNLDFDLSQQLNTLEMIPLLSAQLMWTGKAYPHRGFGCLFPQEANFKSLGVLFDHHLFPSRVKGLSERWLLGGALSTHLLSWKDEDVLSVLRQDRARLFGQDEDPPHEAIITRWPEALPHYTVDLERFLMKLGLSSSSKINLNYFLNKDLKFALVGNYLGRVGLTSILQSALQLANDLERS